MPNQESEFCEKRYSNLEEDFSMPVFGEANGH